jgi:L-lactate dehydrogenase complex protein LldF
VISPQLQSLKQSGDLPFASSLCGACRDACPVAINLPDMLLALRAKAKESETVQETPGERTAMRGYAFAARRPKLFSFAGKVVRGLAAIVTKDGKISSAPVPPLSDWTRYRDLPAPHGGSFRDRWKKSKDDE